MEGGGYSAVAMSVIGRGRGWLQCGFYVCEWAWKRVVTVRCLCL